MSFHLNSNIFNSRVARKTFSKGVFAYYFTPIPKITFHGAKVTWKKGKVISILLDNSNPEFFELVLKPANRHFQKITRAYMEALGYNETRSPSIYYIGRNSRIFVKIHTEKNYYVGQKIDITANVTCAWFGEKCAFKLTD